jgi:hypothetical protein
LLRRRDALDVDRDSSSRRGALVLVLLLASCGSVKGSSGFDARGTGARTDGGAMGDVSGSPREEPAFQPTESHPNPQGYRQVPGGQVSSSESYRAVRTVPPPPAAHLQQSERYRMIGGLVPARQK